MSYTSLPMDCLRMVFNLFPSWKRAAEVKKLGEIYICRFINVDSGNII